MDPSVPSRKPSFDPEAGEAGSPNGALFLFGVILIAAAVSRVLAALGDLWFDEVWTWLLVRDLDSPLDVFVLQHDNNHYLNSLYFYFLGEAKSMISYRIPSLVTGMGSVILASWIALERGRVAALVTAFLFGSSFLLILYSSEARGYGSATLFALASFAAARSHLESRSWPSLLLFWLCSILGFLSHLSMALVYGAIGLWSMAGFQRSEGLGLHWLQSLLRMHLVPITFVAWLYWLDISRIEVLPGNPENFMGILAQVLAHAARLPPYVAGETVMGALALAMILWTIVRLFRRKDLEWVFYAGVLVSGPLIYGASLFFFDNLPYVIRYYLVCYIFFLLAIAYALADWIHAGGWGRAAASVILVVIFVGNTHLTLDLLEKGRGGYHQALQEIADHSSQPIVTISSDEDLQNGLLIAFHSRRLPKGERVIYIPQWNRSQGTPDWYITHSYDRYHRPPATLRRQGHDFDLVASYPAGPYSGWPWFVYKRTAPTGHD